MAIKRIVPVNYLNRDFETIKQGLVDHAKRYFPDTFKDFNEASFGALMIDAVSYIGDNLSFYLDYQVNETFIDSAIEYSNVSRLARQMGFKQKGRGASSGPVALFVKVPRLTNGTGPDTSLVPILKAGTTFSSQQGVNFTLAIDVDFSDPENEIVVATATDNVVLEYAIKAYGIVISGDIDNEEIVVGEYQPNLTITLSNRNVTEVLSVLDNEGHRYYEVENLSQDTIFRRIRNRRDASTNAPIYVLKPLSVPRRYTCERFEGITYLQFGAGSDSSLKNVPVPDPSNVVLKVSGKNYITTSNFDPSRLNENDKLGISPSSTTLNIRYRTNSPNNSNAFARTIVNVGASVMEFPNETASTLQGSKIQVRQSLSVLNEDPIIGDSSGLSIEDLKSRAMGAFSAQNRAVTKQDYESIAYRMPPGLGSVYRCCIVQDPDSTRRNMNMYVISRLDNVTQPVLLNTNVVVKENLKTWLERHKMLSDTIDIRDARIVNFGLQYKVTAASGISAAAVLASVRETIRDYLQVANLGIGEPFNWSSLYQVVNRVPGVLDTIDLELTQKFSTNYSSATINFKENMSMDGRTLYVPEDVILELKYFDTDIVGTIV
jgi:hypothetical protein